MPSVLSPQISHGEFMVFHLPYDPSLKKKEQENFSCSFFGVVLLLDLNSRLGKYDLVF
jgi:hypothetical protein